MSEKEFEADDLEQKDYSYNPKSINVNGIEVTDYTDIEHNRIFLVNRNNILTKPRPSWIPDMDMVCLERDSFLPVCVRDSDGNYFVQKSVLDIPEEKDASKLTAKEKFTKYRKNTYYKMTLDLLAATVDYYIKLKRAELKSKNDTHRVGLPRAMNSMSWERFDGMVSMFNLCEKYKDDEEIKKKYPRNIKKRSPLYDIYTRQTNTAFKDHYQPLLSELRDKKLDMNLQKQDAIDTHKKGEETSYGKTGRSNTLLDKYGFTIKKQNGKSFTSDQIKELDKAAESVWNYFGDLTKLSSEYGLCISVATNTHQHARKAVGLFNSEYNAIGISFFDMTVQDSKEADMVFAHEVTHWLDYKKGEGLHYNYASDKSGTLENEIALKFKNLVRSRNSGSGKPLGEYWYRTCECLARAVEEDYALKHDIHTLDRDMAYVQPEKFIKEIQPLVEQLLNENRLYFSLNEIEPMEQEMNIEKENTEIVYDNYNAASDILKKYNLYDGAEVLYKGRKGVVTICSDAEANAYGNIDFKSTEKDSEGNFLNIQWQFFDKENLPKDLSEMKLLEKEIDVSNKNQNSNDIKAAFNSVIIWDCIRKSFDSPSFHIPFEASLIKEKGGIVTYEYQTLYPPRDSALWNYGAPLDSPVTVQDETKIENVYHNLEEIKKVLKNRTLKDIKGFMGQMVNFQGMDEYKLLSELEKTKTFEELFPVIDLHEVWNEINKDVNFDNPTDSDLVRWVSQYFTQQKKLLDLEKKNEKANKYALITDEKSGEITEISQEEAFNHKKGNGLIGYPGAVRIIENGKYELDYPEFFLIGEGGTYDFEDVLYSTYPSNASGLDKECYRRLGELFNSHFSPFLPYLADGISQYDRGDELGKLLLQLPEIYYEHPEEKMDFHKKIMNILNSKEVKIPYEQAVLNFEKENKDILDAIIIKDSSQQSLRDFSQHVKNGDYGDTLKHGLEETCKACGFPAESIITGVYRDYELNFNGEYIEDGKKPANIRLGEENMSKNIQKEEIKQQELDFSVPEENTADTVTKDSKILDWYKKTYPGDTKMFEDIYPEATFAAFEKAIEEDRYQFNPRYDYGDSVVRERIFQKISELNGEDYSVIYNKWVSLPELREPHYIRDFDGTLIKFAEPEEQLRLNAEDILYMLQNNYMDSENNEPLLTVEKAREYVMEQIYDYWTDGQGNSSSKDGICSYLRALGNYNELRIIDDAILKTCTNPSYLLPGEIEKLKDIKAILKDDSVIKVFDHGNVRFWKDREKAAAYYHNGILGSEGAESEEYKNIYSDLKAGKVICLGSTLPYKSYLDFIAEENLEPVILSCDEKLNIIKEPYSLNDTSEENKEVVRKNELLSKANEKDRDIKSRYYMAYLAYKYKHDEQDVAGYSPETFESDILPDSKKMEKYLSAYPELKELHDTYFSQKINKYESSVFYTNRDSIRKSMYEQRRAFLEVKWTERSGLEYLPEGLVWPLCEADVNFRTVNDEFKNCIKSEFTLVYPSDGEEYSDQNRNTYSFGEDLGTGHKLESLSDRIRNMCSYPDKVFPDFEKAFLKEYGTEQMLSKDKINKINDILLPLKKEYLEALKPLRENLKETEESVRKIKNQAIIDSSSYESAEKSLEESKKAVTDLFLSFASKCIYAEQREVLSGVKQNAYDAAVFYANHAVKNVLIDSFSEESRTAGYDDIDWNEWHSFVSCLPDIADFDSILNKSHELYRSVINKEYKIDFSNVKVLADSPNRRGFESDINVPEETALIFGIEEPFILHVIQKGQNVQISLPEEITEKYKINEKEIKAFYDTVDKDARSLDLSKYVLQQTVLKAQEEIKNEIDTAFKETEVEISSSESNQAFVLDGASNGMLSKYIGTGDIEKINEFREFAAKNIEGTASDKSYFAQMWLYGKIFHFDRNIHTEKEFYHYDYPEEKKLIVDEVKEYFNNENASPKYILCCEGWDNDSSKPRPWSYFIGNSRELLINQARKLISDRAVEAVYLHNTVDWFEEQTKNTLYRIEFNQKTSSAYINGIISERDIENKGNFVYYKSLKEIKNIVDNAKDLPSLSSDNIILKNYGYVSDFNRNVNLVDEDKIKGEPWEPWNTNPNVFLHLYNPKNNKGTVLYINKDIADIILKHNEPSVLEWEDNIANDINKKYPDISKMYITTSLSPLRMGFRDGSKLNLLISESLPEKIREMIGKENTLDAKSSNVSLNSETVDSLSTQKNNYKAVFQSDVFYDGYVLLDEDGNDTFRYTFTDKETAENWAKIINEYPEEVVPLVIRDYIRICDEEKTSPLYKKTFNSINDVIQGINKEKEFLSKCLKYIEIEKAEKGKPYNLIFRLPNKKEYYIEAIEEEGLDYWTCSNEDMTEHVNPGYHVTYHCLMPDIPKDSDFPVKFEEFWTKCTIIQNNRQYFEQLIGQNISKNISEVNDMGKENPEKTPYEELTPKKFMNFYNDDINEIRDVKMDERAAKAVLDSCANEFGLKLSDNKIVSVNDTYPAGQSISASEILRASVIGREDKAAYHLDPKVSVILESRGITGNAKERLFERYHERLNKLFAKQSNNPQFGFSGINNYEEAKAVADLYKWARKNHPYCFDRNIATEENYMDTSVIEEYLVKKGIGLNEFKKTAVPEQKYTFFVKDTAEFEQFADFEPVTNLTAEEAAKKYSELREKGMSCGIGLHIPGDFIFDDPSGNGITLVVNRDDKAVFDIFGDTFIKELNDRQIKDGSARTYIDAYKELYEAFEKNSVAVKKPQFVFDKEAELFKPQNLKLTDEQWRACDALAEKAKMDWWFEEYGSDGDIIKDVSLTDLADLSTGIESGVLAEEMNRDEVNVLLKLFSENLKDFDKEGIESKLSKETYDWKPTVLYNDKDGKPVYSEDEEFIVLHTADDADITFVRKMLSKNNDGEKIYGLSQFDEKGHRQILISSGNCRDTKGINSFIEDYVKTPQKELSYLFPKGFFSDLSEIEKYGAKYDGTFDFNSDGICQVVTAKREILNEIAKDYEYLLNDDFLYEKEDLDLEDARSVHDLALKSNAKDTFESKLEKYPQKKSDWDTIHSLNEEFAESFDSFFKNLSGEKDKFKKCEIKKNIIIQLEGYRRSLNKYLVEFDEPIPEVPESLTSLTGYGTAWDSTKDVKVSVLKKLYKDYGKNLKKIEDGIKAYVDRQETFAIKWDEAKKLAIQNISEEMGESLEAAQNRFEEMDKMEREDRIWAELNKITTSPSVSKTNKTEHKTSVIISPVKLSDILGVMDMRPDLSDDGELKVWDIQRKEYIDNGDEEYTFENAADIFERLDTYISDYFIDDMVEQLNDAGAGPASSETLEELCRIYKNELEKGNDKLNIDELNLAEGIVNPDTVIIDIKPEISVENKKKLTFNYFVRSTSLNSNDKNWFEPVRNLTAEEAAKMMIEKSNEGFIPGIGINIPGHPALDDSASSLPVIESNKDGFWNFTEKAHEVIDNAGSFAPVLINAFEELYVGVKKTVDVMSHETDFIENKKRELGIETKWVFIDSALGTEWRGKGYIGPDYDIFTVRQNDKTFVCAGTSKNYLNAKGIYDNSDKSFIELCELKPEYGNGLFYRFAFPFGTKDFPVDKLSEEENRVFEDALKEHFPLLWNSYEKHTQQLKDKRETINSSFPVQNGKFFHMIEMIDDIKGFAEGISDHIRTKEDFEKTWNLHVADDAQLIRFGDYLENALYDASIASEKGLAETAALASYALNYKPEDYKISDTIGFIKSREEAVKKAFGEVIPGIADVPVSMNGEYMEFIVERTNNNLLPGGVIRVLNADYADHKLRCTYVDPHNNKLDLSVPENIEILKDWLTSPDLASFNIWGRKEIVSDNHKEKHFIRSLREACENAQTISSVNGEEGISTHKLPDIYRSIGIEEKPLYVPYKIFNNMSENGIDAKDMFNIISGIFDPTLITEFESYARKPCSRHDSLCVIPNILTKDHEPVGIHVVEKEGCLEVEAVSKLSSTYIQDKINNKLLVYYDDCPENDIQNVDFTIPDYLLKPYGAENQESIDNDRFRLKSQNMVFENLQQTLESKDAGLKAVIRNDECYTSEFYVYGKDESKPLTRGSIYRDGKLWLSDPTNEHIIDYMNSQPLLEAVCKNIADYQDELERKSHAASQIVSKAHVSNKPFALSVSPDKTKLCLNLVGTPNFAVRERLTECGFSYSTITRQWKAAMNPENLSKFVSTVETLWPNMSDYVKANLAELSVSSDTKQREKKCPIDFSKIENTGVKLAENLRTISRDYPEYNGNLTHILSDLFVNAKPQDKQEILAVFKGCSGSDELNVMLKDFAENRNSPKPEKQEEIGPER